MVASVPSSIGGFRCPMWPMRKMLSGSTPGTLSPMPSVSPAASAHQRRSRAPSPGAVRMVVTAWLRSAGSAMLSAQRAAGAPGLDRRPDRAGEDARAAPRPPPAPPRPGSCRARSAGRRGGASARCRRRAGSRRSARCAAPSPSRGSGSATRAASAFGPWKVKARPGGVISPFWQAATITSTPQASISKRSQARQAMQSTARSAGWPAASSAAAQRRDVVADRRGGVGLHRQHRADRVAAVGAQPLGDPVRVDRGAEAEVHHLDLDAHLPRRLPPSRGRSGRWR